MKLFARVVCSLVLAGALTLVGQHPSEELSPSNLDPPPASTEAPPPRQPEKNPGWSLKELVNPSDPKFYAKLGLLLGSVLLATRAFRQMRSR